MDALLELRDIEDELNTINKLLAEQHQNVKDMLKQYEELNRVHRRGLHGTLLLQDVDHTITSYEHQVASMIKSSAAAQEAVCISRFRAILHI